MNFKSLLLIFVGSGLGGCVRWSFGVFIGTSQLSAFPWATFLANIIACGIAGFVGAWGASRLDSMNGTLFWLIGFCGGFSTMSAFSREWMLLLQNGNTLHQVMYPLSTLIFCVLATYFGAWVFARF